MPVKQMQRTFRDPNALTETQKKIMELAGQGLTPTEMRPYFPTFQADSFRKICSVLRKRGFNIPRHSNAPWPPGKAPPMPNQNFDPRRATLEHLLDLKRAGHTTFLYRLRCEYRMKPGGGDKALAPPLDFSRYSGCGSPAAMCAAE